MHIYSVIGWALAMFFFIAYVFELVRRLDAEAQAFADRERLTDINKSTVARRNQHEGIYE